MTDVAHDEIRSLRFLATCPLGAARKSVHVECYQMKRNITHMNIYTCNTGLERTCQFRVDPFDQYNFLTPVCT